MDDDASRLVAACLKEQETEEKLAVLGRVAPGRWEEILAAAGGHGLAPLLCHTLAPLFPRLDIPEPVREKMRRIYYRSAARNTRIYHELSLVLAALKARGIPVILLKGAHLAETVYGNIALRPMVDVDLLARPADLHRIHRVLAESGYGSADGKVSYQLHLAPYWKKNGVHIDVHFNITWPPVSLRYDPEDLWRRARDHACRNGGDGRDGEGGEGGDGGDGGEGGVGDRLTLCPEDLVLHLCWHTCISHGFANALATVVDIWFIRKHYQDRLDWDQVRDRAVQWGMERAVFVMLALTERLLGPPVPGPFRQEMALDGQVRRAVDEAETMLFHPPGPDDEPVSPIVARLFGSRRWREKLRYLRQRAFPPGEKMSVALRGPGEPHRLRLYGLYRLYLLRVVALTKRHGRIIWAGLRRDPEALRALEMENRKNRLRDWLTGA